MKLLWKNNKFYLFQQKKKQKFLAVVLNYLQQVFESLSQKRNSEIDAGMLEINSELREQLKEVRIISEQLEWLHNLSKNLHTAINGYIERVENL